MREQWDLAWLEKTALAQLSKEQDGTNTYLVTLQREQKHPKCIFVELKLYILNGQFLGYG